LGYNRSELLKPLTLLANLNFICQMQPAFDDAAALFV